MIYTAKQKRAIRTAYKMGNGRWPKGLSDVHAAINDRADLAATFARFSEGGRPRPLDGQRLRNPQ